MTDLLHVQVPARAIEPMAALYGAEEMRRVHSAVSRLQRALDGGAIWNVNSTAQGGGVAELLRSLVAYARGAGVDCRWSVIEGEPAFFLLTKRLHNALHGDPGDNGVFGPEGRGEYERVIAQNAERFREVMRPGDVAILHDPQTAGLAPLLRSFGVRVIWRCHIGADAQNEHVRIGYQFLAPYVEQAEACVFTREAYIPRGPRLARVRVLAPTIDPLSVKNQSMSDAVMSAVLVHAGLIEGPPPTGVAPEFLAEDGTLHRVERAADILRLGRACCEGMPLVVQISRWDRLKDHVGVLRGFARYIEQGGAARLMLAGPNVHAVADDPEGAEVFGEVVTAYRALPHAVRAHVDLANLPMADADENAAMVNALQRRADVIVQKSLKEGFGLTVAEAMWKQKPVIASRVGGIQDQIEHGVSGLLLEEPRDPEEFARALHQVLSNAALAAKLGANAQARVREHYLSLRSLYDFADLITELLAAPAAQRASAGRREDTSAPARGV